MNKYTVWQAKRRLKNIPVTACLVSHDLPPWVRDAFSHIPTADIQYLLRRKAPDILAQLPGDSALLVSDRADRESLYAFHKLIASHRYISLAGCDDEVLGAFRKAGERAGVSVTGFRRDFFSGSSALVLSDPGFPLKLSANCRVMSFRGDFGGRGLLSANFTIPLDTGERLPKNFSPLPIVSHMLAAGAITPDRITVSEVVFVNYNSQIPPNP